MRFCERTCLKKEKENDKEIYAKPTSGLHMYKHSHVHLYTHVHTHTQHTYAHTRTHMHNAPIQTHAQYTNAEYTHTIVVKEIMIL